MPVKLFKVRSQKALRCESGDDFAVDSISNVLFEVSEILCVFRKEIKCCIHILAFENANVQCKRVLLYDSNIILFMFAFASCDSSTQDNGASA